MCPGYEFALRMELWCGFKMLYRAFEALAGGSWLENIGGFEGRILLGNNNSIVRRHSFKLEVVDLATSNIIRILLALNRARMSQLSSILTT